MTALEFKKLKRYLKDRGIYKTWCYEVTQHISFKKYDTESAKEEGVSVIQFYVQRVTPNLVNGIAIPFSWCDSKNGYSFWWWENKYFIDFVVSEKIRKKKENVHN